jgi:hypothetical protein
MKVPQIRPAIPAPSTITSYLDFISDLFREKLLMKTVAMKLGIF